MSALDHLSRSERREAQRYLQRENAKWPVQLKEWPRDQWPKPNDSILRVWRSRGFLVQEYRAPAPAVARLSILRAGLDSNGGWQQDIQWTELQRLKSEAGFGDFDAIEIFPRDRDVVNVANIRHLWIVSSEYLPFAWRSKCS